MSKDRIDDYRTRLQSEKKVEALEQTLTEVFYYAVFKSRDGKYEEAIEYLSLLGGNGNERITNELLKESARQAISIIEGKDKSSKLKPLHTGERTAYSILYNLLYAHDLKKAPQENSRQSTSTGSANSWDNGSKTTRGRSYSRDTSTSFSSSILRYSPLWFFRKSTTPTIPEDPLTISQETLDTIRGIISEEKNTSGEKEAQNLKFKKVMALGDFADSFSLLLGKNKNITDQVVNIIENGLESLDQSKQDGFVSSLEEITGRIGISKRNKEHGATRVIAEINKVFTKNNIPQIALIESKGEIEKVAELPPPPPPPELSDVSTSVTRQRDIPFKS